MEYDIDYDNIIDKIEEKGRELNLEWIEVRIENTFFEKIFYLNGRLKEVSDSHFVGVGIRVIKDGRIGFASTSGLDENDILETVRDAKSIAESNPREIKLNREIYEGSFEFTGYRYHPSKVSYEEKIKWIKEIENGVKDRELAERESMFKPSDFTQESVSIRYGSYYGEIYVWNSDGTNVLFKPLLSGIIVSTILKSDGKYGDAYELIGGSKGVDDFINGERLHRIGVKTLSKALEKLVATHPKAGLQSVISAPRISGVFAHESFGHMSEADHIVANASPLRDRIGEKLGSDYASIVDDGTPEEGGYYYPVDSEGVVTKRVILLDKGVLRNYLLDRETSSRLSMELTGNGRAESYSHPPIVRMRNTFFLPGDWRLEEMIKEIDDGVLVDDERGGEVNLDGTFTFTAGRGYIIKNGEILKPIRDIVLTGNILEMLKYVEGASKKLIVEAVPFGGCGKSGQTVYVGLGGPYMYISRLHIGGK